MESSTRRGHEDKLLGLGNGIIMDLDCDTATSPRDPSKVVELAAQVRYENPCVVHCLSFEVSLRCRPQLHSVDCHCRCCRHWVLEREKNTELNGRERNNGLSFKCRLTFKGFNFLFGETGSDTNLSEIFVSFRYG